MTSLIRPRSQTHQRIESPPSSPRVELQDVNPSTVELVSPTDSTSSGKSKKGKGKARVASEDDEEEDQLTGASEGYVATGDETSNTYPPQTDDEIAERKVAEVRCPCYRVISRPFNNPIAMAFSILFSLAHI